MNPRDKQFWADYDRASARQVGVTEELITAAKAWRDYQDPDSLIDQKRDVRLRLDAEQARQDLLTAIDALENV